MLLVGHEDDDGLWQLIGSSDAAPDGRIGHLSHAIDEDHSLLDVLDLKPGQSASGSYKGGPWTSHFGYPPTPSEYSFSALEIPPGPDLRSARGDAKASRGTNASTRTSGTTPNVAIEMRSRVQGGGMRTSSRLAAHPVVAVTAGILIAVLGGCGTGVPRSPGGASPRGADQGPQDVKTDRTGHRRWLGPSLGRGSLSSPLCSVKM